MLQVEIMKVQVQLTFNVFNTMGGLVGIEDYTNNIDSQIFNLKNSPNPFNPTTTIKFELENKANTSVKVFNLKGELVQTLVDGELNAGQQSFLWNGKDTKGASVASGVYFYSVKSGAKTVTGKMLLVK